MIVALESYLRKNLGDDLFIRVITERYRNIRFTANAYVPYKNLAPNIRIKTNILKRLLNRLRGRKTVYVDTGADAHIILGGSMFIDQGMDRYSLSEELRMKYLNNHKPFFVIGANFGPYKNDYYINEYKKVFSHASDVCFRDKQSADMFKELSNIRVLPDVIFGLDISKYRIVSNKKIVISVINLENRGKLSKWELQYEDKMSEIANYYIGNGYDVVLMSFCKPEGDEKIINRILKKTNHNVRVHHYNGNIDKALREIATSELVVGTRFHSIVLGFIFGKKVLPIIYSNKTANMLSDIKYKGRMINIENISDLEVSTINKIAHKINTLPEIRKQANEQFSSFDAFLEKDK